MVLRICFVLSGFLLAIFAAKLLLNADVNTGYVLALSCFAFASASDPLNSVRFFIGRVDTVPGKEVGYGRIAVTLVIAGIALLIATRAYQSLAS